MKCIIYLKSDFTQSKELIENKEKIINYIEINGSINNEQCRIITNLGKTQSTNILNELLSESKIYRHWLF